MLTIHKNTKHQRLSKAMRKDLISDAKLLSQMEGISGYSVVVWNNNCSGNSRWRSTPPVMPGLVVPEFSKKILERTIAVTDVHDIIDDRFGE